MQTRRLRLRTEKVAGSSPAERAPIAGCSKVGLVHHERLTLGQVLKLRGPCAEDRGGAISLQPTVEVLQTEDFFLAVP